MRDEQLKPNYQMTFNSYVSDCNIKYNAYKQEMIKWLDYTGISSDGSFLFYDTKKLEKKWNEYQEAMKKLNAFKVLYENELRQVK